MEGRQKRWCHIDQPEIIPVLHNIYRPLPGQLIVKKNDIPCVLAHNILIFLVPLHQFIFVDGIRAVVMVCIRITWARLLAEVFLHNVRIPVRMDAKNFFCVKIHKHPVFRMERKTW